MFDSWLIVYALLTCRVDVTNWPNVTAPKNSTKEPNIMALLKVNAPEPTLVPKATNERGKRSDLMIQPTTKNNMQQQKQQQEIVLFYSIRFDYYGLLNKKRG